MVMKIRCILFNIDEVLQETGNDVLLWKQELTSPAGRKLLQDVSAEYPCYGIATEGNLNPEAVQSKLAGMKSIFSGIITRPALGIPENGSMTYQHICKSLGYLPGEVLMVGSHPIRDVLVPAEAGMMTCLFNPLGKLNAGAVPIQNAELTNIQQLPMTISSGIHPSIETALGWLLEYGATQGILQHVFMAAAVAYHLALRFVQQGISVDSILIHRAGLLHDIDKLHPASSRERHGKLGAEILERKGFLEIADIVRFHVPPSEWKRETTPQTWEQKIVFYADKLVNQDHLVTMEERIQDLMNRYPDNRAMLQTNLSHFHDLENEILGIIASSPPEFADWLKEQLNDRRSLPG